MGRAPGNSSRHCSPAGSSSPANRLGRSNRLGKYHKILPLRLRTAAVRGSPITARSANIGRGAPGPKCLPDRAGEVRVPADACLRRASAALLLAECQPAEAPQEERKQRVRHRRGDDQLRRNAQAQKQPPAEPHHLAIEVKGKTAASHWLLASRECEAPRRLMQISLSHIAPRDVCASLLTVVARAMLNNHDQQGGSYHAA